MILKLHMKKIRASAWMCHPARHAGSIRSVLTKQSSCLTGHTGISTEIAPAENVLTTMKTILTMSMMMKTTTMMSMKTGGDAVVPLDMMMTMMMTEAAEILPD